MNRTFYSLDDLTRQLEEARRQAKEMPKALAAEVAPKLAKDIRAVMGTSRLLDLTEATQADRVSKGFTPNDPLVREGSLQKSVEGKAIGGIAAAGSSDPRSKWQEFGTPGARYPIWPRPAFLIGMHDTLEHLESFVGDFIDKVIG